VLQKTAGFQVTVGSGEVEGCPTREEAGKEGERAEGRERRRREGFVCVRGCTSKHMSETPMGVSDVYMRSPPPFPPSSPPSLSRSLPLSLLPHPCKSTAKQSVSGARSNKLSAVMLFIAAAQWRGVCPSGASIAKRVLRALARDGSEAREEARAWGREGLRAGGRD